MASLFRVVLCCLFVAFALGCATYHQKKQRLNDFFINGDYEGAEKLMDKASKEAQGNNRVIYYFNRGVSAFMLGNYAISNQYFRDADYYIEDYTRSIGLQALTLVSNPMVKPYRPEDFECVMIHFYMALNHLFLNDYEGALVECRRVNLQLQSINDKYKANKNKYSIDAFALNLIGMIYETSGDYNNAFIAYRNALEAYESVYLPLFHIQIPFELKQSLMRSAYLTGFKEELTFYENKFNTQFVPEDEDSGNVTFFWMNGFGPVKAEWSLNFFNNGYNNGFVNLADSDLGMTFPIYIGNKTSSEQAAFKNISFLRVAFPKYVSRSPYFTNATITVEQKQYPLELAQPIDLIARQCLNDRMLREIGSGITRLATKKALEALANKQNENLGTLVSIINAATEKADTRNWQTLPFSISYARIPLPHGKHTIQLNAVGQSSDMANFDVNIEKGKTIFMFFHHR
ncbi:MAG: hypothetical protein QM786_10250 [Breznakibacter sp.]